MVCSAQIISGQYGCQEKEQIVNSGEVNFNN